MPDYSSVSHSVPRLFISWVLSPGTTPHCTMYLEGQTTFTLFYPRARTYLRLECMCQTCVEGELQPHPRRHTLTSDSLDGVREAPSISMNDSFSSAVKFFFGARKCDIPFDWSTLPR